MFTALLAVILLGVVWPWIAIRGVSCSLCFNRRRATEGDDVQVTLSIKNSFPWPIWGLAVEGGFFLEDISNSNDSTAVALARVPGWTNPTLNGSLSHIAEDFTHPGFAKLPMHFHLVFGRHGR